MTTNVSYAAVYEGLLSCLGVIVVGVEFVMEAACLLSIIDFHDRRIADTIWPLVILGKYRMT